MHWLLPAMLIALLPAPPAKHLTVTPSLSTKAAAPGSKVSLYVDVTPRPGIHVYAPGAKDYLPIALKLEARSGVTIGALTYPKAQTLTFEGEKVPVYDKPFRLVQDVTLDRSLEEGQTVTVSGTVDYQACDDRVCFIPAKAPVSWSIGIKNK
jgi:DsbC/DsbD-like thiol-disulfide interchange protein